MSIFVHLSLYNEPVLSRGKWETVTSEVCSRRPVYAVAAFWLRSLQEIHVALERCCEVLLLDAHRCFNNTTHKSSLKLPLRAANRLHISYLICSTSVKAEYDVLILRHVSKVTFCPREASKTGISSNTFASKIRCSFAREKRWAWTCFDSHRFHTCACIRSAVGGL